MTDWQQVKGYTNLTKYFMILEQLAVCSWWDRKSQVNIKFVNSIWKKKNRNTSESNKQICEIFNVEI